MEDFGFGLMLGALLMGAVWMRYRLIRRQVQQRPWAPAAIGELRASLATLPRSELTRARDKLRCQEDWRYAYRREVLYGMLAIAMFVTGLLLFM